MEIRTSRGVEKFRGCRPNRFDADTGPAEELLAPHDEPIAEFIESYPDRPPASVGKERILRSQE